VRENYSFAPAGLVPFPLSPGACAPGCILPLLRSLEPATLFHRVAQILVFTHTLQPHAFKAKSRAEFFSRLWSLRRGDRLYRSVETRHPKSLSANCIAVRAGSTRSTFSVCL